MSKCYKVTTNANMDTYKVKITDENNNEIEDIKITDINNNEKSEFEADEEFKILIPIKNMKENKTIKINIETKVETKPILYGRANQENLQDYALVASTYEDGTGYYEDKYYKNETKIIIIKQDEETKERIEGVEFQLLDENKNVIYTNLKTNSNGMITIENLIPGKYYIKETKAVGDYKIYEELIDADIELNEELNVTINNNKNEEPKIEKKQKEKQVSEEQISNQVNEQKILPVTGM